jgi:hypothetical protein
LYPDYLAASFFAALVSLIPLAVFAPKPARKHTDRRFYYDFPATFLLWTMAGKNASYFKEGIVSQ